MVNASVSSGEATKGMGIRIAVCTLGEVTVEGSHDRILARVVVGMAFPLADTRAAAFAIIVAPTFSKSPMMPSRSAV